VPQNVGEIARALVDNAIDGDTTAVRECFDRMDGKVTQSADATQVRGDVTFTLKMLKRYFRRSSGGCSSSSFWRQQASSLSGFAFGCHSTRCSRRSEPSPQLGDVRRDPPCLIAGRD
jgi:hypothetical protein